MALVAVGWVCCCRLGPLGRAERRGILCGSRGAWRHPPSCGEAGVVLGEAWQAWYLAFVWHGLDAF